MKQLDETYYDILNIPHDASPQDISSSYRKLAKILHPDVCESSDAEELFKVVNEAYQILRDPKKRAEYDTTITLAQPSQYKGYYQGTQRYRHPRTWYYADHYHRTGREQTHTNEGRAEPTRKGIPKFVQVLLFYLTLIMAIVIIAELFLLPWINGVNATDARSAFLEGNQWVAEEEYQKAIGSYQTAVSR
ncbi:MAG: DnaJ domain-containing protein, partial [Methanobacteriota archaeon]